MLGWFASIKAQISIIRRIPGDWCLMGVHYLAAGSLAQALGVWPSIPPTSSCALTCYSSSGDGRTSGDSEDSTDEDR